MEKASVLILISEKIALKVNSINIDMVDYCIMIKNSIYLENMTNI